MTPFIKISSGILLTQMSHLCCQFAKVLVFLSSWISNIKLDQAVFKFGGDFVKRDLVQGQKTLQDLARGAAKEKTQEKDCVWPHSNNCKSVSTFPGQA